MALPHLGWVRRIGAGLADAGTSIVVDPAGNRILGGSVSGSVDFGGGVVTGFESDAFVAKYTATGAFAWARRWGSAGVERVVALATDAAGNIVVAGTFAGTIDFGTGPLTSVTGTDTFVAAYSPSGAPLWTDRLPVAATGMTARSDGTVVLIGTAVGAVDFGAGPVAAIGSRDLFIVQYAPGGGLGWVRRAASSGSVTPKAVAVNGNGNIAVTGYFSGTVDLGGVSLSSVGGYDLFVAAYGPLGALSWARRGGGAGTDDGHAVAIDAAGFVVASGYIQGTADLGGGPVGGAVQSLAVAKYGPTGAFVWGRAYGATYGASGNGVVVGATGTIVVTGSFQGTGAFGAATLTSAGIEDIVVSALSSNGASLWSVRYGGTLTDRALAIACDADGHPVLAGSIDYFVDFGAGPVLTMGNGDVFLLDLD